jgi:hypothetical protein
VKNALPAFVAASLALHLAAAGGAWLSSARAHSRKDDTPPPVLSGDSFIAPSLEDLGADDPQQDIVGDITIAPATTGDTSRDRAEDGADRAKPQRRAGATTPPKKRGNAAQPTPPGESGAGATEPSVYGAVGERTAVDLPRGFTRMFANASSADPAWDRAALGAVGDVTVTITLDDTGHIESVQTSGGGPLASSVARTVALLRARPFTAKAKVTHLHISAKISADSNEFFLVGQDEGSSFFRLPSGRRVEARITTR